MPRLIPDHPQVHAAEVNARLHEAGVHDLRLLDADDLRAVFRTRRAPTAATAPAAASLPAAPATGAGITPARPAQAAPDAPPAPTAAEVYRARVSAFLSAPGAAQRQRQALRLAVNTDLDARFAANLLRQLPTDAEADPAVAPASVNPPHPLPAGIDAERARIVSVLTHAEAEGREQLAKTLVFETALDVSAALAILTGAPRAPRVPSIAERAAELVEFGDGDPEPQGRGSAASRAWGKALASVKAASPQVRAGEQDRAGPHWTADPVMAEAIRLAREGFGDG